MESKMLSKANSEADIILKSAKEESLLIKNNNKFKLDSFEKEEKEKIEAEIKLLVTKELASAHMKARKIYLDEREIILDQIINTALEGIRSDKFYENFIEKNVKEFSSDLGNKFKVYCNEKDITLINKIANKLKLNLEIESNNISSGIILVGSGLKVNLSIQSLLEEKIRTIRQIILDTIEK